MDLFTQPIDFSKSKLFTGQLQRLFELLKQRPVSCEDCEELGISGSAFSRRIKDLRDIYKVPITISKKQYTRKFDGKKVNISEYKIAQQ